MVKKLLTAAIIIFSTYALAADWYGTKEKVAGLKQKESVSKDTLWYTYASELALVWTLKAERGTYFNVNDFGLEYPVNLHAVTAYLYDDNYQYNYRIYAKNGVDILYETSADSSINGYNDYYFDSPLVMKDDFWISVIPQTSGFPRIVSTDVTTGDNSYYKKDGNWAPFYEETERYEWAIFAGMSPYAGEDVYPPALRDVAGTSVFINTDAVLTFMVQDQTDVVNPSGEYSIDGGTTWTPFAVNPVVKKGTFNLTGTLPGQNDGVSALVRIYLEDSKGNSAWSDNWEVKWSRYVPLISEQFEGAFPPEGWTLQTATGAGFVQGLFSAGDPVHLGEASLKHFYEEADLDDWIWTYDFAIPAQGACVLSFWDIANYMEYYVLHEVVVSTDGGSTYTQIWNGSNSAHTPEDINLGVWEQITLSLKPYSGTTARIGFHYMGNYATDWYVDEVSVLYDGDAPAITKVMTNESLYPNLYEYIENDMIVSITFEDLAGVAECTGHYSFDGGTTVNDVVFSKAKGTEIWTGTVPTRTDETPGTIYFTYKDIGNNSGTSGNYDIKFIPDVNSSKIVSFSYGAPVFVDNDMTVKLTFTDESSITAVSGLFSDDGWATSSAFEMLPSKDHTYIYTGVLPARSVVTFAEVKFHIIDKPGNEMDSPAYLVRWLKGQQVVFDDFDANHNPDFWNWATPNTAWEVTAADSHSPTHSLTDSPAGNYPDKTKNRIMTAPMDFSAYLAVEAYYWIKFDVEPGWEYVMLQGTTSADAVPDDSQWTTLATYDGYLAPWQYCAVNLGSFAQQSNVRLRFKLDSDAAVNADGAYIDDFRIIGYEEDYAAPLIKYDGPAIITGADYTIPREFTLPVGMGDYKFNVELDDLSGISLVKAVYSVDGGAEQEFIPAVSSGASGVYEVVIPEQAAGSYVEYKVVTKDNSKYFNAGETKIYKIHFGNYLYYQNNDDYVDYLDIIGTSAQSSAQAVAVRATMGPMESGKGHYRSNLVGITIDNYIATDNGYPSDPMYVHVWESVGGLPGQDIMKPIYVVPACTDDSNYEITYVDLRPYADKLSGIEGDVFVGYTTAGDQTLLLYETNDGTPAGMVKFERSWLGLDVDGKLDWSLATGTNYHISAVIDHYEYVDAPVYPTGFTAAVEPDVGVRLAWTGNVKAGIDHYNVYRDIVPSFPIGAPLANVAIPAAEYLDTVVDGTYYYKVTAVDSLGNESTPSAELEVVVSGLNENIPLVTELYQNYPNPFNPETSIKFTLAANSKVSLSVYNTKGEKVMALLDGNMKAGYYNTSFNGSKLVSGVYYYTLKVDGKAMTKKMMLIK